METITLNNDVKVYYIQAKTFPDGVKEAHQKLHAMYPPSAGRSYYGISYPEKGGSLRYLAAVHFENKHESEIPNLGWFVIKQGKYVGEVIKDFMSDIPAIGRTFDKLLKYPHIDPEGYCVEEYFNNTDVRCLVKILED